MRPNALFLPHGTACRTVSGIFCLVGAITVLCRTADASFGLPVFFLFSLLPALLLIAAAVVFFLSSDYGSKALTPLFLFFVASWGSMFFPMKTTVSPAALSQAIISAETDELWLTSLFCFFDFAVLLLYPFADYDKTRKRLFLAVSFFDITVLTLTTPLLRHFSKAPYALNASLVRIIVLGAMFCAVFSLTDSDIDNDTPLRFRTGSRIPVLCAVIGGLSAFCCGTGMIFRYSFSTPESIRSFLRTFGFDSALPDGFGTELLGIGILCLTLYLILHGLKTAKRVFSVLLPVPFAFAVLSFGYRIPALFLHGALSAERLLGGFGAVFTEIAAAVAFALSVRGVRQRFFGMIFTLFSAAFTVVNPYDCLPYPIFRFLFWLILFCYLLGLDSSDWSENPLKIRPLCLIGVLLGILLLTCGTFAFSYSAQENQPLFLSLSALGVTVVGTVTASLCGSYLHTDRT